MKSKSELEQIKEPIITIPTYWTRKKGITKVGDTYFDHPTHLDGGETLTRTLDSLKKVWGKFKVVIVTATVDYGDDELYKDVEKKVHSLIKKYKEHYPIMQFTKSDIKFLKKRMKTYGITDIMSEINLASYAAIRNSQLIATNVLGDGVMIGLDDDEIIMPDHIKKVTEFIGKKIRGEKIYGLGGYYKTKEGDHIVRNLRKPPVDNVFYKKRYFKNRGFVDIDTKKGRIQKSNFVFGGNMAMHRKMFMNVAYDPGITRGENMDYLINAKMQGLHFYFDKELFIVHMPPEKWDKNIKKYLTTGAFSKTSYYKLEQDILRFIYEREKIRECNEHHPELKNVNTNELKPYPGNFFEKGVVKDAIYALEHMYPKAAKKLKLDSNAYVNHALERARKLAPNYFIFNEKWKKLMKCIEKDKELKKHLESKWL